jgi:hypothetical protein
MRAGAQRGWVGPEGDLNRVSIPAVHVVPSERQTIRAQ